MNTRVVYLKCRLLPRDAVRKRDLLTDARLPVGLIHSYIVSKRLKPSPNFFLSLIAPSFECHPMLPSSKGNPSGGVKNTGVVKIYDFRLESPFVFETVRDRPTVSSKR